MWLMDLEYGGNMRAPSYPVDMYSIASGICLHPRGGKRMDQLTADHIANSNLLEDARILREAITEQRWDDWTNGWKDCRRDGFDGMERVLLKIRKVATCRIDNQLLFDLEEHHGQIAVPESLLRYMGFLVTRRS